MNSKDFSHRRKSLLNAYVNQLVGVDVRVLDYDTFLSNMPHRSTFFSVHDTEFVAVHHLENDKDETQIVSGHAQITELLSYYEDYFNNPDLCQKPAALLKSDPAAAKLKGEAAKQFAMIKTLSSRQSILKKVRDRHREEQEYLNNQN
ncbi:MAG: hypothetical protein IT292_05110 [Deltaproteobacteria bacterium]|nr:hypothetical protein [Deltaproteobacteria bacterium]